MFDFQRYQDELDKIISQHKKEDESDRILSFGEVDPLDLLMALSACPPDKFSQDISSTLEKKWSEVIDECRACLPEEHQDQFEVWVLADKKRVEDFGEGLGGRLELLKEYRKLNQISA